MSDQAPPLRSSDGRWWWDGQQWRPTIVAEIEVVTYGGFWFGSPNRRFRKDAKRRSVEGWRVTSQSTQPRTFARNMPPKIVVTYERAR